MAEARSVLESWFDAIEARDVDRITGMMADDFTMETEMMRTPIRGKQMLQDLLVGGMDAYESLRIERRKIVASGRDAAALVRIRAKFSRDLEMFGETLSTAGKELDIMGALFAEVNEEGKISRIMRVRDTLSAVQQLGMSPEQVGRLAQRLQEQMKQQPGRAA